MNDQNPYDSPQADAAAISTNVATVQWLKPLLLLLSVGWVLFLDGVGVSSDFLQYSKEFALVLTTGSLVSLGLACYAAGSIWKLPVGPAWLRVVIGSVLLVPIGFLHVVSFGAIWFLSVETSH